MNLKSLFRPKLLPWFTLVAGGICFILRFFLLHKGMDQKGLLVGSNPLIVALYVLSVLSIAVVLLCCLPMKGGTSRYHRLFPKSTLAAVGCALAAIGALVTCASNVVNKMTPMAILTLVLSFMLAVCFGFLGIARQQGKRPHYLIHTGIGVFLMFHLISQYQIWSPEPQIALYIFQLLASVCLLLTAYQAVCLDIHKGDRRWYALCNQAALFFCCLSLTDDNALFYLGMGAWAATNLCSTHVSRHHSHSHRTEETSEESTEPKEE